MAGKQKTSEPPASAFRLVAADELGLLRVVDVPAGPKWEAAAVVAKWGAPDRANGITALRSTCSGWQPGATALLAVGRLAGGVQVLDGASGAQVATWQAQAGERRQGASGGGGVAGVHFLGGVQPGGAATAAEAAAAARLKVLSVTGGGLASVHTAAGPGDLWEGSGGFVVAPSVACTAVSSDGAALAVGGEGCQLSLWDLAGQSRAWQAKGAKPNAIGIVDPAHVTAVAFVGCRYTTARGGGGGGEAAGCSLGRRVLVAGNASHKLLLYDTAAGRRPQLEVAWREACVTALAADDAGERVWAANGAGAVEALELRAGRMAGTLKGAAGSVRALAMHAGGEPLVASVGLDRFVRVHSTATRANLGRAYTKQQLVDIAWLPPPLLPSIAHEAAGGAEEKPKRRRVSAQAARDEASETSSDSSSDSEAEDGGSRHQNQQQRRRGGGSEGGGKRQTKEVGGKGRLGGKKRRK